MTQPIDTRPTVPPIEGHYAVLRDGDILTSWQIADHDFGIHWTDKGVALDLAGAADIGYDIIATIPPELMTAVADGRVQALLDYIDRLLNTIDEYDSERDLLPAHHPHVCAVADAITAIQGEMK